MCAELHGTSKSVSIISRASNTCASGKQLTWQVHSKSNPWLDALEQASYTRPKPSKTTMVGQNVANNNSGRHHCILRAKWSEMAPRNVTFGVVSRKLWPKQCVGINPNLPTLKVCQTFNVCRIARDSQKCKHHITCEKHMCKWVTIHLASTLHCNP